MGDSRCKRRNNFSLKNLRQLSFVFCRNYKMDLEDGDIEIPNQIEAPKKMFSCHLCDRSFPKKHFLANHLRTHGIRYSQWKMNNTDSEQKIQNQIEIIPTQIEK